MGAFCVSAACPALGPAAGTGKAKLGIANAQRSAGSAGIHWHFAFRHVGVIRLFAALFDVL
jgi:hypothetical protein